MLLSQSLSNHTKSTAVFNETKLGKLSCIKFGVVYIICNQREFCCRNGDKKLVKAMKMDWLYGHLLYQAWDIMETCELLVKEESGQESK